MLSLNEVHWRIGSRSLLEAVSFELAEGEVLAVLGPSGSGKTSLLRLIAGFVAPSAGSITLRGTVGSRAGRVLMPPERRGLAVAFQDATLLPHLDAIGNAAFALRQGSRAQRRAQAREALEAMGLTGMEGREVGTLSGGEAQRVSLARALAADAGLLLLDEPFGNVDRLTRADLLVRLKSHLGGRRAAIVITHDPADAVELGARVLLMKQGRVVADAPADRIVDGRHGTWAASFLGSSRP